MTEVGPLEDRCKDRLDWKRTSFPISSETQVELLPWVCQLRRGHTGLHEAEVGASYREPDGKWPWPSVCEIVVRWGSR